MKKKVFLMIALLWTVAQGAWATTDITTVSMEEGLRTAVQTNGAIIRLETDIQLSKYLLRVAKAQPASAVATIARVAM